MGNETVKLSHRLLDMGFFSALGTSEHPGMEPKEVHVKRGTPNTHDSNNGVTVVYDEIGRPWITVHRWTAQRDFEDWSLYSLITTYGIKHGAYVPHSNDGGNFVHRILAPLMWGAVTA